MQFSIVLISLRLDVDECKGLNDCKDDERCMNTIGSYNCVRICEPGMEMVGDGECIG